MTAPGTAALWSEILPPGTYVALPSADHPYVVASDDPGVLRYVAESVLSAPPGGGAMYSLVYSLVRRILRLRGAWTAARALRPSMTVVVGRRS